MCSFGKNINRFELFLHAPLNSVYKTLNSPVWNSVYLCVVSRLHFSTVMLMTVFYVVSIVVLSTLMTMMVSTVMLIMNYPDWNCYFLTLRVPWVDEEILVSIIKNNFSVYLESKKTKVLLVHPLHFNSLEMSFYISLEQLYKLSCDFYSNSNFAIKLTHH